LGKLCLDWPELTRKAGSDWKT